MTLSSIIFLNPLASFNQTLQPGSSLGDPEFLQGSRTARGWAKGNERKSKSTCMRPQRAQGEGDAPDAWLQENLTTFFICVDTVESSRKADFISSSIVFYGSIMNLCSLADISRSIGTSPLCEVRTESQFCECQKPLRGLLRCEPWLLSLSRRDGHNQRGSEDRVALHLKTRLCSKQQFFAMSTHVPTGSFLQGPGWKMGLRGRVAWLFLWMTALTRRYSDSLRSQGLQKPASSSFLTRLIFFFFFSLILNCTFPNRRVARLL